jgi:FMN phosphatase YigB (HAD superfamily)
MSFAVTFDLDGTLYDEQRARWPFLRATFPWWRTLRVGRRVREELRDRSFANGEALLNTEAGLCAERLDCPVDGARARLSDLFDVRLPRVLARIGSRPGAREALDELARRGVRLGVVSDRGAIRDKLAALDLLHVPWAALVSAEDVGVLKPSPALFLAAAQSLAVAPHRILHIGDRDDTDGTGARAAGCSVAILGTPSLLQLSAVPALLDKKAP